MLINQVDRILVAQRIDQVAEAWQMPQGGVDEGETPRQAALRELKEEIGTNNVKIIGETKEWISYDLPQNLADKVWGGRFRGQEQKWFAMRFLGRDDDINLATENPEFIEWKWIIMDDLLNTAVSFKRDNYAQVITAFRHLV